MTIPITEDQVKFIIYLSSIIGIVSMFLIIALVIGHHKRNGAKPADNYDEIHTKL